MNATATHNKTYEALKSEMGYTNVMQTPKILKIVRTKEGLRERVAVKSGETLK